MRLIQSGLSLCELLIIVNPAIVMLTFIKSVIFNMIRAIKWIVMIH